MDPEHSPDTLTAPVIGRGDPLPPETDKEVVVDLDKPPEKPEAPPRGEPASPPGKEPSGEDARVVWLERQASAQRRIIERLDRTLQNLTAQLATPPKALPAGGKEALPSGTPQATVNKYDQLVEAGQWQEAVALIAEERTKQLLDSRDQAEATKRQEVAQQEALQRHMTLLATSKARVASRYVTLDAEAGDNTSQEAKLYDEAFKQLEHESPDALAYPTAPELVMYRMEDLARQRGITLKPALAINPSGKGNGYSPPRTGGTTPPSRGTGHGRTTVLSAEERQFCDFHGIKYEDYARNRVALTTNEQVTA